MRTNNLLLLADSERNADMLYAVGMFLADPFIYFQRRGRGYMVVSDLELDRARREASRCRVLSLTRLWRRLERQSPRRASLAGVVRLLARERRIKKFFVPECFPYGIACELRRLRVRLKVKPGPLFFPEREFKRVDEVKKISAALMMAEVGMAEAIQALRSAKVGPKGRLGYRGAPLTSEKLRSIIEVSVMQAGGTMQHTIVAGGRQACDPHEEGHGVLRAGEPIVIDVFPRSLKTGYYGDITRTVVKGRAPEAVRHLYQTVEHGQALAIGKMEAGCSCREVHRVVQRHFENRGYRTTRLDGHHVGFFHGTGHGVGLDLHEPPRLSATSPDVLEPGHVVTAEPGLYYPDIGGVRLEDVVLIGRGRARILTQFEKVLEV